MQQKEEESLRQFVKIGEALIVPDVEEFFEMRGDEMGLAFRHAAERLGLSSGGDGKISARVDF